MNEELTDLYKYETEGKTFYASAIVIFNEIASIEYLTQEGYVNKDVPMSELVKIGTGVCHNRKRY